MNFIEKSIKLSHYASVRFYNLRVVIEKKIWKNSQAPKKRVCWYIVKVWIGVKNICIDLFKAFNEKKIKHHGFEKMKYFLINTTGDVLGIIITMDWPFNSNKLVPLSSRSVSKAFSSLISTVVKSAISGRCSRGLWGISSSLSLWSEPGPNLSSRDPLLSGRDFLLLARLTVCDNKLQL